MRSALGRSARYCVLVLLPVLLVLTLTLAPAVANERTGLAPQALSVLVRFTVLSAIELDLDHNASDLPLDFGVVSPVGSPYVRSLVAQVRSNGAWSLRVFKDRNLTSADGLSTIPVDQLRIRTGGGPFTPITGTSLDTAQVVGSGAVAGTPFPLAVDYQLIATWADATERYRATHTFSVTQP